MAITSEDILSWDVAETEHQDMLRELAPRGFIIIHADADAWCPVNSVRVDGVIYDEMMRRSFIFGMERLWAQDQVDAVWESSGLGSPRIDHTWDGLVEWAWDQRHNK